MSKKQKINYYNYYLWLCKELKVTPKEGYELFPEYILMLHINDLLIVANCLPFTENEIDEVTNPTIE